MGGDSCSKGRSFKSQRHILDGHFFTYICCKNWNDVCLKRPKNKRKRGRVGPFLKKESKFHENFCWPNYLSPKRMDQTKCWPTLSTPFTETTHLANLHLVPLLWWQFWLTENLLNLDLTKNIKYFCVKIIQQWNSAEQTLPKICTKFLHTKLSNSNWKRIKPDQQCQGNSDINLPKLHI